MRNGLLLGIFALFMVILDQSGVVSAGKRILSSSRVPADVLESGTLGRSLLKMNLIEVVGPARQWHYGVKGFGPRLEVVQNRQTAGTDVSFIQPFLQELDPNHLSVSLSFKPGDLRDPERGLLTNLDTHIEKTATLSMFRGSELLFQTGCGVVSQGHPERYERGWASFRVYLREEYGLDRLPNGMITDSLAPFTDRLIVRGNSFICSNLSFQIARRIGSLAPGMVRCRFFLNGVDHGLFSLSEHLSRRTMARALGHDDFDFHRNRGSRTPYDAHQGVALEEWVRSLEAHQFTTEILGKVFDLDNLARHLFTISWCGVDDWAQGARLRDRTGDQPLWSWVHWDMDRAFKPSYVKQSGKVYEKAGLDLILGVREVEQVGDRPDTHRSQQHSIRAVLFKGLIENDAEFRALFLDVAATSMNHLLTRQWLGSRIDALTKGLVHGSMKSRGGPTSFMQHRSEWMRGDICELLGLGPAIWCRVHPRGDLSLVVDGHHKMNRYGGWYFPGQTITVEADHPVNWVINGVPSKGTRVEVEVRETLLIVAYS